MLPSNKCIQFFCIHTHQDNIQKSVSLLSYFDIQLLILPIKCLTAKAKRGELFHSPFLRIPGKIPNSWSPWCNVCPHLLCLDITCPVSKVTQNKSPSLTKCYVGQSSSLLLAQTASLSAWIKDCPQFQLYAHCPWILLPCSFPFLYPKDKQTEHKHGQSHTHYQQTQLSQRHSQGDGALWVCDLQKQRNNRHLFLLLQTDGAFKADWNPNLFWAT